MAQANVNMAYIRRTVEDYGTNKRIYRGVNYLEIAKWDGEQYAQRLCDENYELFMRSDVKLTAIAQLMFTSPKILKDWFRTCERVKGFREKHRALVWFLEQTY